MSGRNGKAKITEEQRLQLLQWLGEGLTHKDIVNLALQEEPPFKITAGALLHYRQQYDVELKAIRAEHDTIAVNTGLALRATRIQALVDLALLLEEDLKIKKLTWLKDAKMLGAERYNFETFNEAELRQLRGIYEDISKETGGRVTRTDITSLGKELKGYVAVSPDDWDRATKKDTPT
jgi:hypothetical protein